ncbi:GIY-YIG nuclease family protein [Vibrio natriegens]|uniref:Uncharacterized protein n=1 Tax=Vibrio natriegens NBRC 15636 = ATCC 14048 = DSM 759 TaxID=1219067 RepID=A0AAN1CVB8_VIBNA|nr:GIY-YIG nuclease family protein [Vibrio natriegens]ALR15744.1 hypothetical protein PN96_07005 [Vibrio natriegens NBRC 15636 = ATCC 14048 = DSM 759]ANQ12397.1 hypothetical protein BA890_06345 [Vibrio natriegens NBRC 15636 = ATCC 14048 = DSM 759]EPM42460.1 hypothetical protein M272_00390 [Vibrio natriegens NBRC 15636 = ATCC 14048 = DSM 759]MDX6026778.1 GIY-YIG nuclease family protein [Vibrio natriegens NBRC 15636 = ATCC 14048 = DSM 759]UUI12860.1 GIY-YIG nuclease family protein [Vibrio natrie
MNLDNYEFKDIPLTPAVCRELIVELFAGKTVARNDIVTTVVETHVKLGGRSANAQDVPRTVKKALETLRQKDIAENPSTGYWSISGDTGEEVKEDDDELDFPQQLIEESTTLNPLKVLGKGKSSVYLYYYPAYKKLAELSGNEYWECKVGMSDRDAGLRIMSQTGTALPEIPVLDLLIKTDTPRVLENTLHGLLILKNRKLSGSPGTEWFLTNPKEIESFLALMDIT